MLPVATKWTGDPDVEPEAGDEIVTPAKAATADIRMVPRIRRVVFKTESPRLGVGVAVELLADYPSRNKTNSRGSA